MHCKKSNYDVYVGRPTKWGNPFSHKKLPGIITVSTREEAIAAYTEWIKSQPELLKDLHELKGKTIACWCKPQACHGDVLAKLADDVS